MQRLPGSSVSRVGKRILLVAQSSLLDYSIKAAIKPVCVLFLSTLDLCGYYISELGIVWYLLNALIIVIEYTLSDLIQFAKSKVIGIVEIFLRKLPKLGIFFHGILLSKLLIERSSYLLLKFWVIF